MSYYKTDSRHNHGLKQQKRSIRQKRITQIQKINKNTGKL